MVTPPSNVLVTLKCQDYLLEHQVLVAPVNISAALGYIFNDGVNSSKKWTITIEPSDIEYFESGE
jgi:hypothetical protein